MGRIGTFIFGIAFGAGLIWGAQRYHLLRTDEGFHLVPKTQQTLSDAYVDIREFRLNDWARHKHLAAALLQARKEHLLGDSAQGTVRDTLQNTFNSFTQ